jgi:hypothetical protein
MAPARPSSRLKPVLLTNCIHPEVPTEAAPADKTHSPCGTGFSRESVNRHTANPAVLVPPSSRLKPVPLNTAHNLWGRLQPGKRQSPHRKSRGVSTAIFPAEAGPTSNRIHPVGPASAGKASAATPQLPVLHAIKRQTGLRLCSRHATITHRTPSAFFWSDVGTFSRMNAR